MLATLKIIFLCRLYANPFVALFTVFCNNEFHGKNSKVNNNNDNRYEWHRNKPTTFMFIDWRAKKEKRSRSQKPPKKQLDCFAVLSTRFSLSTSVVEKIPPVKLRKLFPFLSRDDIEGLAKQSVKNQLEPQLLNSYQGHQKSITGLIYREQNQILISSSRDKSVRLWNLAGQVFVL